LFFVKYSTNISCTVSLLIFVISLNIRANNFEWLLSILLFWIFKHTCSS
jgi:hypothetical protein